MQLTSPIVEMRIPTYNRPALLRRALNALLAQTCANWRAVILDDGDSARPIVSELGDDRLVYSPNPVRLGAASNINRAFSRQPMAGGEFFYVLEDDNLIVPMFIEELAAKLEAEQAVTAHPASLSRVLLKAGLSFKKNTDEPIDDGNNRARWPYPHWSSVGPAGLCGHGGACESGGEWQWLGRRARVYL